MNYTLRDYAGMELTLNADQASKIAAAAELIEVSVNGQTHYLNPKNIASIKPMQGAAATERIGLSAGNDYGTIPEGVKQAARLHS